MLTSLSKIISGLGSPTKDAVITTTTELARQETADDNLESDDLLLLSESHVSSALSVLALAVHDFSSKVDAANLTEHANTMKDHFEESLTQNSQLTMLPNFNISATGNETGLYLVIDLGGLTLRVAVIDIAAPHTEDEQDRSDRIEIVIEKKWEILDSFKYINKAFFNFIASKIYETLQEQTSLPIDPNTTINTGITWSFPLDQESHNSGKIVHVSKGFTLDPEICNQDLKQVLESAMISQHNLSLDVKVIINDSLAVYAAGSFLDKYMKLAMVLGTGFNMCCSLQADKLHSEKRLLLSAVLLNSELSMFGVNLQKDLSTRFDTIVDSRFCNKDIHFKPHMSMDPILHSIFQPAELMASGRYLPELTRLILVDMIDNGELFANVNHKELEKLYQPYEGFTGELMCAIVETADHQVVSDRIVKHYNLSQLVCEDDIKRIKAAGNSVIQRAAYIVAASIIAFIKLMESHNGEFQNKLVDIGFVGSVLMYFHSYRDLIVKLVNDNDLIKAMDLHVGLKPIENSSIIGAAIGAAYYVDHSQ